MLSGFFFARFNVIKFIRNFLFTIKNINDYQLINTLLQTYVVCSLTKQLYSSGVYQSLRKLIA